jgi:hypothetical protein
MTNPNERATQLLDAHVAHELQQLHGAQLGKLIDDSIDALFAWLSGVKVHEAVTRAQIDSVIERYVIDLKISGAFTELAGEMSRLVVTSRLSEHTRVDDVMPPDSFLQFADKLAGLEPLWRELLHLIVRSNASAALLSSTLQHGVLDAMFGAEGEAGRQTLLEGLLARLRPVITERVTPQLSVYLEKLLKQALQRSEKQLASALDVDAVRSLIDELWDGVAPLKLSDAFAYVGSHDLEDFVVLGYEFWQRYRKSSYFRGISHEMVDHFLTKYGGGSVLALLDDLGVTAPMVRDELRGFLSPLLEHALATGALERGIRAHLEPFYRSDAALAILSK